MLFWKQTSAWRVLAFQCDFLGEKLGDGSNLPDLGTSHVKCRWYFHQRALSLQGWGRKNHNHKQAWPTQHRNALHYHWVLKTKWKVIQVKSCLIPLWKRQSQKPEKWNKDQGFMESSYWERKQNNASKGCRFIRRSFRQKANPVLSTRRHGAAAPGSNSADSHSPFLRVRLRNTVLCTVEGSPLSPRK